MKRLSSGVLGRGGRGRTTKRSALACARVAAISILALSGSAGAQGVGLLPPEPLAEGGRTLEEAGILKPDGRPWAILLGKALFWDQQVGSDGQACASCHFHAGADTRTINAFTPGFLVQPTEDTGFGALRFFEGEPIALTVPEGATRSGGFPIDSSYELRSGDFPLYELSDYRDRNSPILYFTNDAVSSPGSFAQTFTRVKRGHGSEDRCGEAEGTVFHAGGLAARQVEPRNTPTTINSAFNFLNFWDGRASHQFNGVGPFGPRDIAGDPRKRLIVLENGQPALGYLKVDNASLASQAVAPVVSEKEMSCDGRVFADVGRKLLSRRPLALQKIDPHDSVLGVPNAVGNIDLRDRSGLGLKREYTYDELIRRAFDEKYWTAKGRYRIGDSGQLEPPKGGGYTQAEYNFSMFWGIAIMLYERTLVSDQSRFDAWFASCNPAATNTSGLTVPIGNPGVTCRSGDPDPVAHGFTAQEALGWGLFNNGGTGIRNAGNPGCNGCHNGPALFSEAQFQQGTAFVPVERSRIDDRGPGTPNIPIPTAEERAAGQRSTVEGAVHDRGFFNIGTRPTGLDVGIGGADPYGNPLSLARMFLLEEVRAQTGDTTPVVDPAGISDPCNTTGLIEGGFPNLAQAPEVNQGRYPGCLAGNTGTVTGFDWTQERELVDGSFKTPTIRNIGLTPPYFHFGGYSNLRDVVRFYARGGSRRDRSHVSSSNSGDTSGTGPLGQGWGPALGPHFGTNVDFFIRDVRSTDEQIDALVAFMLTLTDPRVQCDQDPFDHPSLRVARRPLTQDLDRNGRADDDLFELAETGRDGYAASSGLCIPNTGDLFSPGMQARSGGPTN